MRIAIGGFLHESNTYAVEATGVTKLSDFDTCEGDDIVRMHGDLPTYVGGMLTEARRAGHEIVPTYLASGDIGGTIERSTFEHIANALTASICAALPVDAVVLSLHGAAAAEGVDDCELDVARRIRAVIGPDVPLVATFDLHGQPTPEWAEVFTAMFGVIYYPHTDCFERGVEAVTILGEIEAGRLRPLAHIEQLPMLLPAATTDEGFPAADLNTIAAEVEAWPGVVDCTIFHGFPQADLARTGASVVCTSNDDPALAARGAQHVAAWLWEQRERFILELFGPDDAVRMASHERRFPAVLAEASDNPGAGCPGDGTKLLRAMLDNPIPGMAFGTIVDADTVQQAVDAGVGAVITLSLGGRQGPMQGQPIVGDAVVEALSDGQFELRALAPGAPMRLGRCARIRIGDVVVIVASIAEQTFDEQVFVLHDIDVAQCSIIGLKSSQHFRSGFAELAGQIITVDGGGLGSERMDAFVRTRARCPMWPIDPDAAYVPRTSAATEADEVEQPGASA
jgi:microcystin degradation protein MlrC